MSPDKAPGASSLFTQARKVARFLRLYGPLRTIAKISGRLRLDLPLTFQNYSQPDIGIVGCGQFAYATIGYYLSRAFGNRIAVCYDIDQHASHTFARAMRVATRATSFQEVLQHEGVRTVYIASNHASHADYATYAIQQGLDVYIEKPISVSLSQLRGLLRAASRSKSRVFAGYNRPFAKAVRDLRQALKVRRDAGFTISCFVCGHQIPLDHWYRRPEEGTRICGNIGHWLDLMVHVLAWRGLPTQLHISIAYSDPAEPDDNISISIASDRRDLFSVMLTSRSEPFEGINETIHIQHADTTCKIDDFRRMTIWQGPRLLNRRYWPKDVGHRLAILQPFTTEYARDWHEVELSTLLMLHIADMVRAGQRHSTFSFEESWRQLLQSVESQ